MKKFKDPIYGYIKIPKTIVTRIIDTPEFQRLRYIKQTSYLPVYSAALHNRFIHSLGVYFLGGIVSDTLFNNSITILKECSIESNIKEIFQLACLLHDVGHAPFSHSGEGFYIDEQKSLYVKLKQEVNNESFSADVDYYHKNGKVAAPHEIMSVIVALERFGSFPGLDEYRDFFARCITGYKYRDIENNISHAALNAFITLLNSTTIDVDRLDYLIRDAQVMGYNSISIDYHRLLESVILVKVQDTTAYSPIQLAFHKSALSVIENVIYAHDAEKKWIQNHPVILYEVFLIQRLLAAVNSDYRKNTGNELFSLESLSPIADGERLADNPLVSAINNEIDKAIELIPDTNTKDAILDSLNIAKQNLKQLNKSARITLLCNDDIVHLAKTTDQYYADELFNRGLRRHPVWKSESEYKIYVDGFIGDEVYDELQSQIKILNKFLLEEAPSPSINQEAVEYCQDRLAEIPSSGLSKADEQDMKTRYSILLGWLKMFNEICKAQNLKYFDFLIIPASKFESGFKKEDLSNTPIFFPELGKTYPLGKLINLFTIKDISRHAFFYVYYRKAPNDTIDAQQVGREIAKLVLGKS